MKIQYIILKINQKIIYMIINIISILCNKENDFSILMMEYKIFIKVKKKNF